MARRPSIGSPALAAALASVLAGCASELPPVQSCETAAECPATSRCVSRSCVANAPPAAVVALPEGTLLSNVLVAFDGSGSADPDPDDAVVSFAWAFRAVDAPCAPPTVAGTGPVAQVRFACAGRFAVDLAVTDSMSGTGTRSVEIDVEPYAGAPLFSIGEDVALDHACTAVPTRCAPDGEVVLSAFVTELAVDELSFEWAVEPPPDRPLDANRRVTFAPSAAAPSPTVLIETDGQAISGDWIFRVTVRDGAGVIGTAPVRVSVGNRPPVVERTIPTVNHAFDGERFTASGEIPFTVSDPDGDQLVGPQVEWHHAGDGDGTFDGAVLDGPPRVTFSVAVPYGAPEDALRLIGGEGLERSVWFAVSDVNGAETAEAWPVVVANRRPILVSEPGAFAVHHLYDPVTESYRADVSLSTWRDPDGDPLAQVSGTGTGDPVCGPVVVPMGSGDREATATCSLPFAGTPAVANFAGDHVVAQRIQDPWEEADAASTVAFTIQNRAPVVTSTATHVVSGACRSSTCCASIPGECLIWSDVALATTSSVPSRWTDPDGDPLQVEAPAQGLVTPVQPLVCEPASCALELGLAEVTVCGTPERTTLDTTISDGLATVTGPLPVERVCP